MGGADSRHRHSKTNAASANLSHDRASRNTRTLDKENAHSLSSLGPDPVPRGARCSAAGERSSIASVVPSSLIAVLLAVALRPRAQASSVLSAGGWLDPNSESAAVAARLANEFGAGQSSVIAPLPVETPGADATSAEFQAAIARLDRRPVRGARRDGRDRLRRDRRPALHQHRRRRRLRRRRAQRRPTRPPSRSSTGSRPRSHRRPATPIALDGYGPLTKDSADQSEKDLQRAETRLAARSPPSS